MENLPNEVLIKILIWIPRKEILNLALTCKVLANTFSDDFYWKTRFEEHYGYYYFPPKTTWLKHYQDDLEYITTWEIRDMLIMYAEFGHFDLVLQELEDLDEEMVFSIEYSDIQTLVCLCIIGLALNATQFVKKIIKEYGMIMHIPNIFIKNDKTFMGDKYHTHTFSSDTEIIFWIDYILKHCIHVRKNALDSTCYGEADEIVEYIFDYHKYLMTDKLILYMTEKLVSKEELTKMISEK